LSQLNLHGEGAILKVSSTFLHYNLFISILWFGWIRVYWVPYSCISLNSEPDMFAASMTW
jgi:hypothetical protein